MDEIADGDGARRRADREAELAHRSTGGDRAQRQFVAARDGNRGDGGLEALAHIGVAQRHGDIIVRVDPVESGQIGHDAAMIPIDTGVNATCPTLAPSRNAGYQRSGTRERRRRREFEDAEAIR